MLSQIILCSRTAHYHWSSKHQRNVSAVIDKNHSLSFRYEIPFFRFLVITHKCSHWFLFPLRFHIRGDKMVFFLLLLLFCSLLALHFSFPQSNNNGLRLIYFDGTCNETITTLFFSFVLFECNNFLVDWIPKMLTLHKNVSSVETVKYIFLFLWYSMKTFSLKFFLWKADFLWHCVCEFNMKWEDLSMNEYFPLVNPSKLNNLHINNLKHF